MVESYQPVFEVTRGRIVESGSHRELLAAQGRYEESWTRQMQQNG